MTDIDTPELDKMRSVKEHSQRIGAFLEWLSEKGVRFLGENYCKNCGSSDIGESRGDGYCRSCDSRNFGYRWSTIEQCLADYFEIDLKKVEEERRSILDVLYKGDPNG